MRSAFAVTASASAPDSVVVEIEAKVHCVQVQDGELLHGMLHNLQHDAHSSNSEQILGPDIFDTRDPRLVRVFGQVSPESLDTS